MLGHGFLLLSAYNIALSSCLYTIDASAVSIKIFATPFIHRVYLNRFSIMRTFPSIYTNAVDTLINRYKCCHKFYILYLSSFDKNCWECNHVHCSFVAMRNWDVFVLHCCKCNIFDRTKTKKPKNIGLYMKYDQIYRKITPSVPK